MASDLPLNRWPLTGYCNHACMSVYLIAKVSQIRACLVTSGPFPHLASTLNYAHRGQSMTLLTYSTCDGPHVHRTDSKPLAMLQPSLPRTFQHITLQKLAFGPTPPTRSASRKSPRSSVHFMEMTLVRFWDWTDPTTATEGLPDVIRQPQVTIFLPGGRPQLVDNPLAFYPFGKSLPDGFQDTLEFPIGGELATAYYSKWNRTYRWPQSTPDTPAEDYKQLNK